MSDFDRHIGRATQGNHRPIAGRESDMTTSHTGQHYVFQVTNEDQLKRFLLSGSLGGFYVNAQQDLEGQLDFLYAINGTQNSEEEAQHLLSVIIDFSNQGRAVKNDYAILAMVAFSMSPYNSVRQMVYSNLRTVVRTATHLFMFASLVKQLRGWGKGLKKALARWYLEKNPEALSYQLVKYRNREGWTHRDMLRVAHPRTEDPLYNTLFQYAAHPEDETNRGRVCEFYPLVNAYETMRRFQTEAAQEGSSSETIAEGLRLVREHNLPHEVVPNDWKRRTDVWEELLQAGMLPEATLRNLGRMSSIGVFQNRNNVEAVRNVFSSENLQRARLHPLRIYTALKVYASGGGSLGSLTWTPNREIGNILETAFYNSFAYCEPTYSRVMLSLDVSGSMSAPINGRFFSPCKKHEVSCAEASAIIAKSFKAVESNTTVNAFSDHLTDANYAFDGVDSIGDSVRRLAQIPMGATNLSLPLENALNSQEHYDAFIMMTDNEVNVYGMHPAKLLQRYRQQVNPNAKLIVIGMQANNISIADPADPNTLEIGGFDASCPKLITEFLKL